MFNIEDRRVVEITIEFNITGIIEWLKSGGKFEDIDKIKRDEYGSWGDSITQKYVIDMLPIGKTSNAYYHRSKNLVSQNLSGIDYLGKVDEETKFLLRKDEIQTLEWSIWRGSLLLMIHGKKGREIIFATPPLTEVIELETKGKLNNGGSLKDNDQKIKVVISLNEDGTPKESMEIWRGSASDRSLGYGNALGHVSFSTLNFEIEY
jgi:hypothetical protein